MKCVFLFLFPDLNVLYCNVVSGIYLSYIYKIRDVHYNSHNNSLTMRIPKNGKSTTIYEKKLWDVAREIQSSYEDTFQLKTQSFSILNVCLMQTV